jgi:cardiolipin synthase A/B
VWIVGLYLLNTFFMLVVLIREVRRPVRALTWLTVGHVLPVIGFGLYLIASSPVRIKQAIPTSPNNGSDTLPDSFSRSASVIAQALRKLTVNGLRSARVQVLTNGVETYEKLIKSVQNAEKTIDLEYYIYRDDQIGRRITDLLIERAAAGVKVRFLRDGWGSRQFPRREIIRMMDAGIECRTLFPVRFPWLRSTLNYRDHCKIVVIDGKEAFTGGINIGDEYTGFQPNVGFWRDTHVRMVGEIAVDLQAIFNAHWNISSPERMKKRTRWNTKTKNTRKPFQGPRYKSNISSPCAASLSTWSVELGAELSSMNSIGVNAAPSTKALQKAYVQTLQGNPGIPIQIIRQAYFICLTQATKTIDITTPYFVPDADIIMALKTSVTRGVRVRLLVPRHVDHKIVGAASRTYYGELLEAGVHIYLYDKGVLHAKLMTIDGDIAVVGAANYDMRSFRLDFEVSEVLYSADVAREITEQFERDLTDSVSLRIEDLLHRTLSQRILEQGARLFSSLL